MIARAELIARVKFDPGSRANELTPIPWPAGLAPSPIDSGGGGGAQPLPVADVLVVTYTAAEGRALADVLTPGVQTTSWNSYTKDWSEYESLLDGDAPARESKRLGLWHLTQIGTKRVLCFKSELHPAIDGPKLPILKLWPQILQEVAPKLVITGGTAGGVGLQTQLGDVAVPTVVRWDCQEQFKAESWAKAPYATLQLSAAMSTALAGAAALIAVNTDKIPAEYRSRPVKIWESGTTLTTDFFAWGDTTDHFGLLAEARDCEVVEMDDAALGLARESMSEPPPFLSIRNASDPVMPGDQSLEEQRSGAGKIYEKYGYFTTVGSAIACWAIVTAI
jgi:nucleoside phosphorylase